MVGRLAENPFLKADRAAQATKLSSPPAYLWQKKPAQKFAAPEKPAAAQAAASGKLAEDHAELLARTETAAHGARGGIGQGVIGDGALRLDARCADENEKQ